MSERIYKVDKRVDKWCRDHKKCKGCKFVGGECVAPVGHSIEVYNEFNRKMERLILAELNR